MINVANCQDFGFKELEIGIEYTQWIFSILKPYIGQRIIEIGSGIGVMIKNYQNSELVIASDINAIYLSLIRKRYSTKKWKNLRVRYLDVTKISQKALHYFQRLALDSAVMINVLEHIQDDRLALNNIYKILSAHGRILLFVPAIPKLFGSLDRAFGHCRRYSKIELVTKVESAGFSVEYVSYFNLVGILWWSMAGKIVRSQNLPPSTGFLLKIIVPFLQRIESFISVPIGQNLIIVARKI